MQRLVICLLCWFFLCVAAQGQGTATYSVVFTATWSTTTHPQSFPPSPHFSGLIGGIHNDNVTFWATGEVASPGIKAMAELGSKNPLRTEVEQSITDGMAEAVLSGGGIGRSPGSQRMQFTITPDFPLVTLVSMLAPSPDWFVGVRGHSLLEDGQWKQSDEVTLFVYDAGTDSGHSYTSPNQATNPPELITRLEDFPFLVDGVVEPVGTFTFTLENVEQPTTGFFRTQGKEIVNREGEPVAIKGLGLGGWLLPEGYMLHFPASETLGPGSLRNMREKIAELIGEDGAEEFFTLYRENYVAEKDIKAIAAWGFDHVRLPFHYNIFYDLESETFLEEGFDLLDTFLDWCRTYGLDVILDMHAAPGAQNEGDISDSDGEARLWTEPEKYWPPTIKIWAEIAGRYANEPLIIGYDLINEPVLPAQKPDGTPIPTSDLRDLYVEITEAIREVDTNHMVFIEGNYYATTFDEYLQVPFDDNMVYAFHKYWNPPDQGTINYLIDLRNNTNVPLWLGETGENSNYWYYGVIQLMDRQDPAIGWNWWTHKKIETITSPLSAPFAPGYEDVLEYWRGNKPRPSNEVARRGLLGMARGLDLDNCVLRPGVLASLTDPDYNTLREPFKEHVIPGNVFAVDYDVGNHGTTYHDSDLMNVGGGTTGNSGYQYRNDGVDIEISTDPEGFDYNVGWTERLEYLTYTVTVEESTGYDIDIRVASLGDGGQFRLYLNDDQIGESVTVNNTGGWQNWRSQKLSNVLLPAGTHILKLLVVQGGFNVNRMRFTKHLGTAQEEVAELPAEPRLLQAYPNPFSDHVRIVFESPGSVRARLEVYDILGRKMLVTPLQEYPAGKSTVTLRPDLAAGMYMFRLMLQDAHSVHEFSQPLVLSK